MAVTSTPVIDTTSSTLYVVAAIKNPAVNPPYQQLLYALDLKTGTPKLGSPVLIKASFTGLYQPQGGDKDPEPSPGPNQIPFSPLHEHLRAAMVLYNGILYLTYASHSDVGPFYGEILGYDAKTLQLLKTFITTPNVLGGEAGIWQGGGGTGNRRERQHVRCHRQRNMGPGTGASNFVSRLGPKRTQTAYECHGNSRQSRCDPAILRGHNQLVYSKQLR